MHSRLRRTAFLALLTLAALPLAGAQQVSGKVVGYAGYVTFQMTEVAIR